MRTSCEPTAYFPVGRISGSPVARFAYQVRDVGGMTGFLLSVPIPGKYVTFNEYYAKAVRNRRCWVCPRITAIKVTVIALASHSHPGALSMQGLFKTQSQHGHSMLWFAVEPARIP